MPCQIRAVKIDYKSIRCFDLLAFTTESQTELHVEAEVAAEPLRLSRRDSAEVQRIAKAFVTPAAQSNHPDYCELDNVPIVDVGMQIGFEVCALVHMSVIRSVHYDMDIISRLRKVNAQLILVVVIAGPDNPASREE